MTANSITTIVIFGITGDLSVRRLLPSLFRLHNNGQIRDETRIVGFSRTRYDRDAFLGRLRDGVAGVGGLADRLDEWDRFAEQISYVPGDLTTPADYTGLDEHIKSLEAGHARRNRLYYLSVAPSLYGEAARHLGETGLAETPDGASANRHGGGWRRVVIEKPFGHDAASAEELDRALREAFRENQIYRIDHYVGKETVQNLLYFRFLNTIFEPVWNRNYVDHVQITALEDFGVEGRVDFYDETGVVRDMFQNHLFQLLTMVAMEPPATVDAEALRDEKVKVLRSIRCPTPDEAVRGRYRGYAGLEGAAEDSITPTYAAMRLWVDNWRWEGVPFYLRSGKATAEKRTEIVIQFKRPPHILLGLERDAQVEPNTLALSIQPDEAIHLRFNAKIPGGGTRTRFVDMEFHYGNSFRGQPIPDAYEQLLRDALRGDPSLFTRSDHVRQAWQIIDPLLEAWERDSVPPLEEYERGSEGPAGAVGLMERDGRRWQPASNEHGGRGRRHALHSPRHP